jgi:hypothetical protein
MLRPRTDRNPKNERSGPSVASRAKGVRAGRRVAVSLRDKKAKPINQNVRAELAKSRKRAEYRIRRVSRIGGS